MGENQEGKPIRRRSALNIILGFGIFAWLAGLFNIVLRFFIPPQRKIAEKTVSLGKKDSISKNKNYNAKNQSLIFPYGGRPAILIKDSEGKYRAFTAECTHLQCIVEYQPSKKVFFCNCHGGAYDINGKNISGPPPTPLTELSVVEKNDELFITRKV